MISDSVMYFFKKHTKPDTQHTVVLYGTIHQLGTISYTQMVL